MWEGVQQAIGLKERNNGNDGSAILRDESPEQSAAHWVDGGLGGLRAAVGEQLPFKNFFITTPTQRENGAEKHKAPTITYEGIPIYTHVYSRDSNDARLVLPTLKVGSREGGYTFDSEYIKGAKLDEKKQLVVVPPRTNAQNTNEKRLVALRESKATIPDVEQTRGVVLPLSTPKNAPAKLMLTTRHETMVGEPPVSVQYYVYRIYEQRMIDGQPQQVVLEENLGLPGLTPVDEGVTDQQGKAKYKDVVVWTPASKGIVLPLDN